jgi:hypothetical protein
MRRGLLALLGLLVASSMASAQVQVAPGVRFQAVDTAATKVSPDEVVTRLMTFDHNNDGRVAISELSERMRPLVARGDRNGDEALDRSELQALAVAPSTVAAAQNGRLVARQGGGYSFGGGDSLSSKNHIEGALEDLRLASDTKERALPIVRSYAETVEAAAKAELISRMEPLLSREQLVVFNAMLNADQRRQVVLKSPTGEQRQVFIASGRGDLTQRVDAMNLGAAGTEQAHQAIEQFKTRLRLGDELDRAGLLAKLKPLLGPEELENYGAALARRPVVANGAPFFGLNDALIRVQGAVNVVKPAVLIEHQAPAATLISR